MENPLIQSFRKNLSTCQGCGSVGNMKFVVTVSVDKTTSAQDAIEKKDTGIAIAVNTQNLQAEPHPRIIQIAVEAEDAVTAIQNFKSGIVIGVTQ